ncbi:uncharacterized protein LOC133797429 [Humulus lupulus]|uniref:uncharacterized protein LOC133797429 n=1 Tax=Humulus lupulus TaxID=3486 RepID=UPI002B41721E|nr:uncharacterized protein LOC133797429 [Humulus lupulus]
MWALPYVSPPGQLHLLHPNSKTPRAVSANSQPPQNDVGGLGRTILTALQSNPKPITTTSTASIPNPNPMLKREEKKEEDGKQISGSDVLWAMQKAAAKKNRVSGKSKSKKKKMMMIMSREGLSSVSGHREEELAGDYSNVRPLCIKTEWGPKLDELEKSLQELYETK